MQTKQPTVELSKVKLLRPKTSQFFNHQNLLRFLGFSQ